MSAEKVIYNLLSTNSNLIAVVPKAKIFAGFIPVDAVLPAIAYSLVSSKESTAIGLTTLKNVSRMQVTVSAKSYVLVKQVSDLVKLACNHKQGTFNGVVTDYVILDNVGADFRDDQVGIFYSTIDFLIAHN